MINDCTEHDVETRIRCVGCSEFLATLSKFRTSDRKNIQACVNQEIRKWQKIYIFLLFQALWRRRNTIVTIVSCWWLSIFLLSAWSLGVVPMVQPTQNLGGAKCSTLGKQQHFCLGRRLSKHEMTRYAKIWGAWPPGITPSHAYGSCTACF